MTKDVVVLGGGLAGVSAAIRARVLGRKVRIVEGSARLGGLLNGVIIDGMEFPLGTHFLRECTCSEINTILFSEDYSWTHFPYLKNGNISNDTIDSDTGFLNISSFPFSFQCRYYFELFFLFVSPRRLFVGYQSSKDLDTYMLSQHGKTIRTIFSQLSLKYFNLPLNVQQYQSLSPLVITSRVKAFSPRISRFLKHLKFFDLRLSFHLSSEGSTPYSSFVPKSFSYSTWWDLVSYRLVQFGISIDYDIKCSYSEKDNLILFARGNEVVDSVSPDNYDVIDTVGLGSVKQSKVFTTLLFYKSSSKPCIDSYFLTSYSIHCPFSRLTLCQNIEPVHSGFVVEVVHPSDVNIDESSFNLSLYSYLNRLNIFPMDSQFFYLKSICLNGGGFRPKYSSPPLLSRQHTWRQVGIANENQWFMDEVV